MTIEVYQAEFRSLGEGYELDASTTIHEFVEGQAPGYENTEEHRVNAYVNGSLIDQNEWRATVINPSDEVRFVLEPKGGAALVGAIVAAVVAVAAAVLLRPSIPNIGGRGSQQGSSIYEVNAQGNKPKLGDVIPEQAGRHKKYPDILTAPVRRYVSRREQELCLFLSLGKGSFERSINDLKVGSTPITTLPGVSYQFFEPGEYVLGNRAAYNWYSAPEVGASTGASGLRLRGVTAEGADYNGTGSVGGDRLIILSGIPASWSDDIRLRILARQPVTVSSNGQSLLGNFPHILSGQLVTIQGNAALSGNYRARSVNASGMLLENRETGALITGLPPGDYNLYVDRTGALYGIVERINNNQIAIMQRYTNVETVDATWSGWPQVLDTHLSITPSNATPASLWTGPFLACPENETTATIEWDVFFPNGLGFIDDNGDIEPRTRQIELQWRSLGSSAWNSIIKEVTDSTRDQIGVTFRDDLPSQVTPEIRVRRLTLEDTSTQALDRIEWLGLRCELPANDSYSDVSTLALVIQGSDLIASQTENQINIVETRKIPRWDGSQWTAPQPTRDISAWVRHIAHSVGYTDADIDMDELIRLHGIWTSRGETFNHIQDEPTTVKEALNTVLRAGMAELTTDGGRITPVRDGPRSTPEHMYSPQNYIEGGDLSVSVTTPRHDDPDGIDVEYMNEESWTLEVIKCRLPGDQGFRAEKVRLDGVTVPKQVYQIGMRERSRQKYTRWQYRFATPTDALNSKYLSYCVVAGEVPGFAQSAIIEAVSQESDGVHIESSEPLDWNSGVEHVISWRRDDGSYSGAWPAERGDDDYHVIAQMPAGEVPVIQRNMEPPHLLFGEGFHVLVRNIEPDGESVDVTAENYDERVYAYDNANYP